MNGVRSQYYADNHSTSPNSLATKAHSSAPVVLAIVVMILLLLVTIVLFKLIAGLTPLDGTGTWHARTSSHIVTSMFVGQENRSTVTTRYIYGEYCVTPGTVITWVNHSNVNHTVTGRNNEFDSGIIIPGESFSRTFDTVGTFHFYCKLHPQEEGQVRVTTGNCTVI